MNLPFRGKGLTGQSWWLQRANVKNSVLAKKFRLPIQQFYKKSGKIKRSALFNVKSMHSEHEISRFGIVISSRTVKNSSGRNKIKRIIFNWISLRGLQRVPGKDTIITVLPAAGALSKKEIGKNLEELLI